MTTNANLPAMPFQEVNGITGGMITSHNNHKGLSKREMFAMAAMQGLLVNAELNGLTFDTAPAQAVKCADALLAELEKQQ